MGTNALYFSVRGENNGGTDGLAQVNSSYKYYFNMVSTKLNVHRAARAKLVEEMAKNGANCGVALLQVRKLDIIQRTSFHNAHTGINLL